jgi:hypothetical protein
MRYSVLLVALLELIIRGRNEVGCAEPGKD